MDGTAICKLTNTLAYCEESANDCKFFNIPSADVQEVKHGEWKWGHQNGQYGIYCTNCNAMFVDKGNVEEIAYSHDYCPKCGAKMAGKGDT